MIRVRIGLHTFARNLCTCQRSLTKHSVSEEKFYRTMSKLIARDIVGKKRKKPSLFHTQLSISSPTVNRASAGGTKRAHQVANVLFPYISDFVSSGQLHPALADRGVDISKVKVTPDFSAVNISWIARGTEQDDETQQFLEGGSAKLRSMLISLHLLSRMPMINFVKDLSEARLQEVDELLRKADFGPDHDIDDITLRQRRLLSGSKATRNTANKPTNKANTDEMRVEKSSIDSSRFSETFTEEFNAKPCDYERIDREADVFSTIPINDDSLKTAADIQPPDLNSEIRNAMSAFNEKEGDRISNTNIAARHDVYALNRDVLLRKVQASINKSRDRSYTDESNCDAVKMDMKEFADQLRRKRAVKLGRTKVSNRSDTFMSGDLNSLRASERDEGESGYVDDDDCYEAYNSDDDRR